MLRTLVPAVAPRALSLLLVATLASSPLHAFGDGVESESQEIPIGIAGQGYALASDGPWLLVGPVQIGSSRLVYLFRREQGAWSHSQTLGGLSPTAASNAFGSAVAIENDWMAVGDRGGKSDGLEEAGGVHLYRNTPTGWVKDSKLLAPVPSAYERFGSNLVLHGGLLLVANGPDPLLTGATPSVRAYRRIGGQWHLGGELTLAGHWNGIAPALAYDPPWLVVGESHLDASGQPGNEQNGRVRFYEVGPAGFELRQELYGEPFVHLGKAVAIDGDTALLGAPGERSFAPGHDSVHVMQRDAAGIWRRTQLLEPAVTDSDPWTDGFGASVALRGDVAVVGSPLFRIGDAFASGAAATFRRIDGLWRHAEQLRPSDQGQYDHFAPAVHLVSSEEVVVPSQQHVHDTFGTSLYVFELPQK